MDYRYDEATDTIGPVADLRLRIPWPHGDAACRLLAPGAERPVEARAAGSALEVTVPELDPYAVLLIEPARPAG